MTNHCSRQVSEVSEEQRHGLQRWLHLRKTAREQLAGQDRVSGPRNRAKNQRARRASGLRQ